MTYYNVTDFDGDALDLVEHVNSELSGMPFIVFHAVIALLTILVLSRRGFLVEDSVITAGFITSLVAYLWFTAGVVDLQYVFTPLSLVIVGILIKGNG